MPLFFNLHSQCLGSASSSFTWIVAIAITWSPCPSPIHLSCCHQEEQRSDKVSLSPKSFHGIPWPIEYTLVVNRFSIPRLLPSGLKLPFQLPLFLHIFVYPVFITISLSNSLLPTKKKKSFYICSH